MGSLKIEMNRRKEWKSSNQIAIKKPPKPLSGTAACSQALVTAIDYPAIPPPPAPILLKCRQIV